MDVKEKQRVQKTHQLVGFDEDQGQPELYYTLGHPEMLLRQLWKHLWLACQVLQMHKGRGTFISE